MHMGGNQPLLPAAGCPQLPAVRSCRLSSAAGYRQLPAVLSYQLSAADGCPQLPTGRPATRGWIKIGGRFSFFLWIKNSQERRSGLGGPWTTLGRMYRMCRPMRLLSGILMLLYCTVVRVMFDVEIQESGI